MSKSSVLRVRVQGVDWVKPVAVPSIPGQEAPSSAPSFNARVVAERTTGDAWAGNGEPMMNFQLKDQGLLQPGKLYEITFTEVTENPA